MLQQDYLMRLIMQFVDGIKRSMDREKRNPKEAADSLEDALSRALDMDAEVLLGLAPESFASVAQISIADPRIAVYVVYTMALGPIICARPAVTTRHGFAMTRHAPLRPPAAFRRPAPTIFPAKKTSMNCSQKTVSARVNTRISLYVFPGSVFLAAIREKPCGLSLLGISRPKR